MTSQEIINLVHEVDELEREDAKAEQEAVARRARIASLRLRLDGIAGLSALKAKTNAIKVTIATKKRRESPRQDAIRALITRKPAATYYDVVMELYGSRTSANVLNARSLISNMKKAGQIQGEPGAWRVVQQDSAVRQLGSDNAFALGA